MNAPVASSKLSTRQLVGLCVLAVAAILLYRFWEAGRRDSSGEAMRIVAEEMGLTVVREGRNFWLRGTIDEFQIFVRPELERIGGNTRQYTILRLTGPGFPYGSIVPASLRQSVIGIPEGESLQQTGDAAFDDAVRVTSTSSEILAHFSSDAREKVREAVEAGWTLDKATWVAREVNFITDSSKLRQLLSVGLAAAQASAVPGELGPALESIANRDPLPAVRDQARQALEAYYLARPRLKPFFMAIPHQDGATPKSRSISQLKEIVAEQAQHSEFLNYGDTVESSIRPTLSQTAFANWQNRLIRILIHARLPTIRKIRSSCS